MEWLNQDNHNLITASGWVKSAWNAFTGDELSLSAKQIVLLAKRDILQFKTVPVTPTKRLEQNGILFREFEFLKKTGVIDSSHQWGNVSKSFDNKIISEVMSHQDHYLTETFQAMSSGKDDTVE